MLSGGINPSLKQPEEKKKKERGGISVLYFYLDEMSRLRLTSHVTRVAMHVVCRHALMLMFVFKCVAGKGVS